MKFTNRSLLPILAGIILLGLSCGSREPNVPPNILLVSIDTLRPDMLGCYGYMRPTSPTIDRLASEGVLFETAVANSPWTLPSHASMLTGVYANRHGMKTPGTDLSARITTGAELLSAHGYSTGAFINSAFLVLQNGFERGFKVFRTIPRRLTDAAPTEIAGPALEYLAGPGTEPFFLFIHLYDVHGDYRSLPEFEERFVRPYEGDVDGSVRQLKSFRRGEFSIDDEDCFHLIDLYVSGIRQTDDLIDRVLSGMEKTGVLDRTIVILTSDHGEEFFEHGSVLHSRTQYDEVLRIPLIFRGPGVPRGVRIAEPVSTVDILPTMLALAGIDSDLEFDGIDISPLWDDDGFSVPENRPLFGEADYTNEEDDITRSVRLAGHKLVRNRLTGEVYLFDLEEDPAEKVNLLEERGEIAARLEKALEAFDRVRSTDTPQAELSPEDRELLEELGYIR